jgi:hypothetical protein
MKDEAVIRATGKNWKEWFAMLDKAGAKKMSHRDIAITVHKLLGKKGSTNITTNGSWWSQMVTVEYERARGKRQVNQNETGFLVAVHKTVDMSVPELVKVWDKLTRSSAVRAKGLERKASKSKRAMIRYGAKIGGVVVNFDERANGKARIMVEAIRLPNKTSVEKERVFWKKVLENLRS